MGKFKIILFGVITLLCLIAWYEFYCVVNGFDSFDMNLTVNTGLYLHYIKSVGKEELVYRYLPFIIATLFAVWGKKQFHSTKVLNIVLVLFILAVHIQFAVDHVITDECIRVALLNLPKSPTLNEYVQALFMQGVGGIILSIFYFVAIDKKKPLHLLQLIPFVATFAVHYTYDLILAIY
jgi:hypothetical protein